MPSKVEMLLLKRSLKKEAPAKPSKEDEMQKRKQRIAEMLTPQYDNGEVTRNFVSFEYKGEQYLRSVVVGEEAVVFKVQPDYSLEMIGTWDAEGKKIKFE